MILLVFISFDIFAQTTKIGSGDSTRPVTLNSPEEWHSLIAEVRQGALDKCQVNHPEVTEIIITHLHTIEWI